MKPWEALDLDDSDDVASPLRPCKRRHQNQPSESNQTTPSSHQPSSQTQTLNSCLIPGPAGIIQSAMLRKARDTNRSFSSGEAPVATQEYIRRAVEDAEQDDDFKRNPWLSALGMVDVLPSTPLSSIKKFLHFGKVDLVVAVIKSCTPNGLGDLMVTLKDPTGTVRGTINHKVLTEDEFVKEISVGSVLILQKVAFFAPSRSSHYLNITLRNVVKVISKDVGPPLRMNYPASTVNYAAPEHGEKATVVQNAPSLEQGRTEGMVEEISETANGRGRLPIDSQKGNRNAFSGSDHYSNKRRSINQIAALGREPLVTQGAVPMDTSDDDLGTLDGKDKWTKPGDQPASLQNITNGADVVESHNDKEIQIIDRLQKQRQPQISRISLPEWTDEQLNELFVDDFVDDGSLW